MSRKNMSRKIWLARLAGIGLVLALCSSATAARANDDSGESDSADDARGVPELDARGAGVALTILGGALFVLHGRRKRSTSVAV
jgi:hypothetical protein